MRLLLTAFAAVLISAPAIAQDDEASSPLNEISTAYDARGWEAVGRLNIGWGGMCSGALIAPDLVLTAAHCAFDARGKVVEPSNITFHAGFRNGRAAASRKVKRVVVHPGYQYQGAEGVFDVSNDLALVQLQSEIRLSNIVPFATGARPRKGDSVGVVSYAHNRASSPSIQESCHILARQRGALIMSCDVDFGSSGAPIFDLSQDYPRIVSVVSAKGEMQGRRVSFGTNLESPLAEMMAILRGGGGQIAAPEVNILRSDAPRRLVGGGGGDDGAKFVKP